MSQFDRIVVTLCVTAVIIVMAALNRAAGSAEPTPTWPVPAEVANAQGYADWCGGYVQVVASTHEVVVEGCDR